MISLETSKRDFLTGCFMKEDLAPFLKNVWSESRTLKKPFAILLIDVDHFKSFNDKYGHLCGDEVLKYFSSSLRLSLGDTENIPFRFGGDEFVIVFPGRASAPAYAMALKLAKTIKSRHFLLKGRQFKMSFSAGIAAYPLDGDTVEEVLDRADKAMYVSKSLGHRGHITQYRKIWLKRLGSFLPLVYFLIIAAAVFFAYQYVSATGNVAVRKFFRKAPKIAPVRIPMPAIRQDDSALDTIYLKSGGILKGTIVGERGDQIELRLKLDRGEGTMFLRRSDIQEIEKPAKPAPESQPN